MWLTVGLLFFVVGLILLLDIRKPKNFPPGPRWLPVIGSAHTVAKTRKEMGGYLYKATLQLAKEHGSSVVGLRVGKDRLVVCCDYPSIKEMSSNEDLDGRPNGPFYETRTMGRRRGILLTDGHFWQEQKRFILRHLKEFGFGKKTMVELGEQEAFSLTQRVNEAVLQSNGQAILEISTLFNINVLNTLWMIMAGIRYTPKDADLHHLQNLLTELFANIDMVGALFSHFPILRYLAPETSGYNQFIQLHEKLWAFLQAELDKHKATFTKNSPRDFMDVYLEALQDPNKPDSFSDLQLLAVCLDLFMAGSETTSKSLGFCFLYLILNQRVQDKAREEIIRVVGRERLPSANDRPNMPYMEAVVLESLRHFAGRTFAIPHTALKDSTIQGYFIPKGTMVIPNLNGCMMDSYWGDPMDFRPERFIDQEGKLSIPEQFIAFGYGRRKCIGQAMTRSNMFLFTSSLLQNFKFSVPPGQPPPSKDGVDGCTPGTGILHALVTRV